MTSEEKQATIIIIQYLTYVTAMSKIYIRLPLDPWTPAWHLHFLQVTAGAGPNHPEEKSPKVPGWLRKSFSEAG